MDAGQKTLMLIIVLAIAPFVGSLAIIIVNMIAEKDIPPILPQVNSYSLAQAVIAFFTGIFLARADAMFYAIGLAVVVGLFFLVSIHALIDKRQGKLTSEHVKDIINNRVKGNLRQGAELTDAECIAWALVDVDFVPNSLPNRMSDYPRMRKRKLLARIINNYFIAPTAATLSEADFLVEPDKARFLRRLYVSISFIAVLLYFVTIYLLVKTYSN